MALVVGWGLGRQLCAHYPLFQEIWQRPRPHPHRRLTWPGKRCPSSCTLSPIRLRMAVFTAEQKNCDARNGMFGRFAHSSTAVTYSSRTGHHGTSPFHSAQSNIQLTWDSAQRRSPSLSMETCGHSAMVGPRRFHPTPRALKFPTAFAQKTTSP